MKEQHDHHQNQHGQHLRFSKFHTPLFPICYKACPLSSPNNKKYLMIPDIITEPRPNSKYLSPAFTPPSENRTYILLQGQFFSNYLASKKNGVCLMTQQQVWGLAYSIIQGLLATTAIQGHGKGISHLKEYMIQRIDNKHYKLIYHQKMRSQLEVANSQHYRWSQFYLSPEQLRGEFIQQKSIVFSLGVMLLNICSFQDSSRIIYRDDVYEVSWQIVQQKLALCRKNYSKQMISFINHCLQQDHNSRYEFAALRCFLLRKMDKILQKQSTLLSQILAVDPDCRNISYDLKLNPPYEYSIASQMQSNHRHPPTHLMNNSGIKSKQKARKKGTRFEKIKSTSSNNSINKIQSDAKNSSNSIDRVSPLMDSKKSESQESEQLKQRKSPEKFNQSLVIEYRGTFGDRDNLIHQQNLKTISRMNQQSLSTKIPQSLQIQHPSELVNEPQQVMVDVTEFQPKFTQVKGQEKDQTPFFEIDTPKGFGTFNFHQFQSVNTEENCLNTMQKNRLLQAQSFQGIPQPLTHFRTLQLRICLSSIEELKKKIGKVGVWIQGDLYFGDFHNGHRNGLGLQIFQNGQYYYGYFKEDLFEGQGFYFWNKEQYFLGLFKSGQKCYGQLFGPVSYQGSFLENFRHGSGTCWYSNGQIYYGQWQKGKRHGKGLFVDACQNKFLGSWKKGKKNGFGKLETKEFAIEGEWKGEQIVGDATIFYSQGGSFRGKINKIFEKVQGVYVSKSGWRFQGTYQNDESVHGTMHLVNGDRYVGEFKGGKRHGRGKYYYANGQVYEGEWSQNKKKSEVSV